ncbi:MAG: hypothetical protein HC875_07910, partial [Anaerolineales bacterium]|nr:hypothetical protein [Anaerolineales bacterium]
MGLAANGLLFIPALTSLRTIAALILLAFLPGWVWLDAFFDPPPKNNSRQESPLPGISERLTMAVGLSLALTILGAMFAVYLPGPLDFWRLLLVINLIIVAGLIFSGWQHRSPCPLPPA